MRTRTTYLEKRIIVEGCNGDWAQKRYLPTLLEKVVKEEIKLWAIDIEPQILLSSPKLADLWHTARGQKKVHHIDKIQDEQSYKNLFDASHVFVVTPDQYHSEIAEFWLDRLIPGGKIFIEKPLDAFVRLAFKLKRRIEREEKKEAIFAFDHYLARAYPFLQDKERHLKEIGGIERMKFHILESFGIPPNRVQALDKGVLSDLFCHVLAITSALIEQNSIPLREVLQRVKLEEVKGAQYIECPISGETFAYIKFFIDDMGVETTIGKHVNTSDSKFVKIYGSQGHIKLDFLGDAFSIFDSQGNDKKHGKLNPRHVESFLEKLYQEENPSSVPGILSFEAAFEILMILDEAKMRIGKMPKYETMTPISELLRKL